MSKKKSKGVVLYEDPKPRLRHHDLMRDYHDLQRETDAMRSKLKAENKRKSILAAEVRFLRKRHKYLVTANDDNTNPSQELKTYAHARNLLKQTTKIPKEHVLIRNESSQRRSPFVPEPKRVKQQYMAEQTVTTNKKTSLGRKQAVKHISTTVSNSYQKEKRPSRKEVVAPNVTDIYGKERTLCENEYAASRNSIPAFDLNEASFPSFDLNETSTVMRIS